MSVKSVLGILVVALALLATRTASAYVYFTPDALMASFFPGATAIDAVTFTPDPAARAQLETALGYELPRAEYTLRVGRGAAGVLGYALLDQQLGQHEPIDFGVLLDSAAHVQRVEVLVYREAYGDGVRGAAFRKQFVGLGPGAAMRPGKEIRVVSGATISTRAIATGVKRATAIVAAYLGQPRG
ncbi:MAG: FMN-binding protein [Pseudomonadota bacterium]|nr:FMN-binding protein [Pseudomonadota bacterium]